MTKQEEQPRKQSAKISNPRRIFEALLDDPMNLSVAKLALSTGYDIVDAKDGLLVLREKNGDNSCK